MGRPLLTWSGHVAKRSLGHYDPAHNTIVVSRVFDRKKTPRYAVEYLLYHEMLHLKHPVKVREASACIRAISNGGAAVSGVGQGEGIFENAVT